MSQSERQLNTKITGKQHTIKTDKNATTFNETVSVTGTKKK